MRITWRGVELRLLAPVLLLVPLGFIVTHIALSGTFEPGPLELALGYVACSSSLTSSSSRSAIAATS
jgi:hypothetical protein